MRVLQENHPHWKEEHEIVQSPIDEELGNIALVRRNDEGVDGVHAGGFTTKLTNSKVISIKKIVPGCFPVR